MFAATGGRQSAARADVPADPRSHGPRVCADVRGVARLRQPVAPPRRAVELPAGRASPVVVRQPWLVEAPDEAAALEQLPERVGRDTEVNRVCLFPIP
jgi:hypothetical protein